MKKTLLLTLYCASLIAQESFVLKEQTVTATHLEQDELSYAAPVEIYTEQDIKDTKATTVYDFLNQETSVVVMPSFGNQFSQLLDIRGYGLSSGNQNIVVVVNGRRLNNIDSAPQLLSSIPINSIKKIEILKGAGSVEYGDGANAGVISITTKDFNGVNFSARTGSFNTDYGSFGAGYASDLFSLSAFGDYFETDGQRDLEANGNKQDSARSKTGSFDAKLYPNDGLELRLGWAATRISTNYANAITKDQYNDDPTQSGIPGFFGGSFTSQDLDTDLWSIGAQYEINELFSIDANIYTEDKESVYTSSGFKAEYDYDSADLTFKFEKDTLKVVTGLYGFNGERRSSSDTVTKDNLAGFVKANYGLRQHSFSAGIRVEKVSYEYKPSLGSTTKDDETLEAYELGYNYKLTKQQSIFASYAHAYQAPNIDSFFLFGGAFNAIIDSMKSDTYNLGYNYFTKENKFKATLFYVDLTDEIYFNPITYENRNLDSSSKLGLELYDKYLILENLYVSGSYTYVDAQVKEDAALGVKDKTLPGVSDHNINASIGYSPTQESKLIASHTYRSSAYALNDFGNNFTQKQEAYNATDITASYQYDKHIEIFAKVQNLFDEDNGIWIRDDAIYPVNFQRTVQIGLNGSF